VCMVITVYIVQTPVLQRHSSGWSAVDAGTIISSHTASMALVPPYMYWCAPAAPSRPSIGAARSSGGPVGPGKAGLSRDRAGFDVGVGARHDCPIVPEC
jgi:hypothetical protein